MIVQENILAKLTAETITKIIGELGQGAISNLESELAKRVAAIKTTEDMVEKGYKYRFLVIVLGRRKYGTVVGSQTIEWMTPKDPWG